MLLKLEKYQALLPKCCRQCWHACDECDEDYHCKDWQKYRQKLTGAFALSLGCRSIHSRTIFKKHRGNTTAALINLFENKTPYYILYNTTEIIFHRALQRYKLQSSYYNCHYHYNQHYQYQNNNNNNNNKNNIIITGFKVSYCCHYYYLVGWICCMLRSHCLHNIPYACQKQ